MPRFPRLAVLIAAAIVGQDAAAQSLFLPNAFVVDRAGSTLLDIAGARLVDARGNVRLCGQAMVMQAHPRLDASGFLVRLSEGPLPPTVRVEQWSGSGVPQWQVESTFFSGIAAVPTGGALISRQQVGDDLIEFQRLDARGNELWRSRAVRGEQPPSFYEFMVDKHGRALFTLPRPVSERQWQVEVGMLDADGRLAWVHRQSRGGFSIPTLADDGQGNFWWHLGALLTTEGGQPSALVRMSAWGTPLSQRLGRELVGGREIERPVAGAEDDLWFLAGKPDVDVELVRLPEGGGLARFPTGRRVATQLIADGDGAWLIANTGVHEFTIDHYTAAGRQWSRVLRGLRDARLDIQPGGDLRLLALENSGISLRRISAATGQLLWRKSRAQIDRECTALNGGQD